MARKKTYNEDYYGVDAGREWISSGSETAFAKLVPGNIWTYYYGGDDPLNPNYETNQYHWGRPFDESVVLWEISENASFSHNIAVWIEASSTLTVNYYDSNPSEPQKLIMAGYDVHGGSYGKTWVYPIYRIADDWTYPEGLVDSALIYDVSYKNIVLNTRISLFNPNTETELSFNSYEDFIEYVSDSTYYPLTPETISVAIEYECCRGPVIPRVWGTDYGPEGESWECKLDTFSYRPIPEYEPLRRRVQDKPNVGQQYDWTDDKVFSPFLQALSQQWCGTSAEYLNYSKSIGYNVNFNVSEIQNGAHEIDQYAWANISGFFARLNTANQVFDDVSYHFEHHIYDYETHMYIPNGTDLSSHSYDSNIKFCSQLVIDSKDSELTYPEAMARALMHEIAYLGFYFGLDEYTSKNKVTGSETDGINLFLALFDAGVTTGEFVTGDAIKDQPNADAESAIDIMPVDPDEYEANTPELTNFSFDISGVHMYSLVDLPSLINNINSIPVKTMDNDLNREVYFFGADPYDYMLCYGMIPMFLVPQSYIDDAELDYINIGRYTSTSAFGASEVKAMKRKLKIPLRRLLIKPVKIPREFNNFLDFEPYTTLSLYLPFAGSIELPPSTFVGHTISVYSSLDLLAGTVTYIIYADDVQYTTVTCNVRLEIPLHGIDVSSYSELMVRTAAEKRSAIFNMTSNIGSTLGRAGTSLGVSALKGNIASAVSSIIGGTLSVGGYIMDVFNQLDLANTIMSRTAPSPVTISSGSMPDGYSNTMVPYLVRMLPEYASGFKTEKYGKSNGFACYINDTISNYHGLTVIENPILDDIPISAKEKEMLRKLLSQGVILP